MGNKLLPSRVFFSKNPSLCKARNLVPSSLIDFVDKRSGYKITRRVKRRAGVKFLPEGCDPHTRALCFCTLSRSFFWRLLAFSTKAKIWLRADHLTFELIWFGQESLVEIKIFPQRTIVYFAVRDTLFSADFSLEISLQDIKWRVPSFSVKDSTKFQKSFWIQYFSV